MRDYITEAQQLLEGHSTITLKAMGRAINKTVAIGEKNLLGTRLFASDRCKLALGASMWS